MRALEARHGARKTAPATGPKAGAPGGVLTRPARAETWPIVALLALRAEGPEHLGGLEDSANLPMRGAADHQPRAGPTLMQRIQTPRLTLTASGHTPLNTPLRAPRHQGHWSKACLKAKHSSERFLMRG